jgi:hypothetical protein
MTTRTLLTVLALASGGLVALVACSSSAEPDKFGSSDQYCAARAETLCANIALKCGASVDACKTSETSACKTVASAATSQGGKYQSGAVQTCLDKLNEIYGDTGSHITPAGEKAAADVCGQVFTGSKPAMTVCDKTKAYECEGSLICDGVCATKQTVGLMGGCGNAGQVCDTDTYCQPLGGKNFCVAKKKEGEICGADNPCIDADRCVNHCVARATVGQPCDNDGECSVEAPFCDLTSSPHQCRPKYESRNPACKEFGAL